VGTTPASGTHVYGYWYTVEAVGPNHDFSPTSHQTTLNRPLGPFDEQRGDKPYYVRGVPVHATEFGFSYDDQLNVLFPSGSNHSLTLELSQNPEWSPTGFYEYFVYKGPDCFHDEQAFLGGISVGLAGFEYDTTYSYRAR